jgi:hypothetical protein
VLELASPSVLPVGCDGESYFTRLALRCTDPEARLPGAVSWRPAALPSELTVTPDGEIRGVAPMGLHELRVTAQAGELSLPTVLQLDVLERCWAFALTDESSVAQATPRAGLRALRLDSGEVQRVPDELQEGESVLSFEPSSDGRFVTVVVESATSLPPRRLRLFRLQGARIAELVVNEQGTHVAHAFSPDGSQLAVVTDLNIDPGAPDDSRLSVIDLSTATEAVTLEESFVVSYDLGLGWSDASTIQYLGASSLDPSFYMPQVITLGEGPGLADASRGEVLYPLDPGNTLEWFRPVKNGSLVMTGELNFVERVSEAAFRNTDAQVLSASFGYSAGAVAGQLSLRASDYSAEPPLLGPGCDRVLSWSSDESSLLCSFEGTLRRFTRAATELPASVVDVSFAAAATRRAVLSTTGQWLALADAEHGVFVLERNTSAALARSVDSIEAERWDLGFSPDERYVWIQSGATLSIASLVAGQSPALRVVNTRLLEPPPCNEFGLPWPGEWCGAPELDAARVISARSGRHLAFSTVEGVTIIDLADPSRAHVLSAALPSSCPSGCIRFQ